MDPTILLKIEGAVEHPLNLSYEDLLALPAESQIEDVSQFQPTRKGDGVLLEPILQRSNPKPDAKYLTLHADRDDFHVSIPLDAVRSECVVVYRLEGQPLSIERGGPIRFLIRNPSACHTSELDECANVKYLSRIELSVQRGQDTRPADESEHAALHAKEAPVAQS